MGLTGARVCCTLALVCAVISFSSVVVHDPLSESRVVASVELVGDEGPAIFERALFGKESRSARIALLRSVGVRRSQEDMSDRRGFRIAVGWSAVHEHGLKSQGLLQLGRAKRCLATEEQPTGSASTRHGRTTTDSRSILVLGSRCLDG